MTPQLHVLHAGPMMTVQDPGRPGYLRFGVSASGPMDAGAFAVANALVGNAPDAACLEFALTGGALELSHPARVAVTGGSVDITVDGQRLSPWRAFLAKGGSRITIGGLKDAVWGYVAISGGVATLPVMGSRATHLRSAVGGYQGRSLRAGDTVPLGVASKGPLLTLTQPFRPRSGPIHVVPGPQDHFFAEAVWDRFLHEPFQATSARDRMAMILEGPSLSAERGHDIVSDGTVMGSIQVPPSGRPIVLMADRQTTGGYPKIATIVSHDLGRLSQTVRGAPVRFRAVDAGSAVAAERAARVRLENALASLAAT